MIAHEIAHTFTKRHTKNFWKAVKTIYPNYEEGEALFIKYEKVLSNSFHQKMPIDEMD